MARTDTLPHFLTDVADAIREKKGTSETIQASDFDTEIENLPSGGGLDWSAIGYSEEPDTGIEEGYEYAMEVKNNWTPAISLLNKFNANEKLKFMPLVDTSIATNMSQMFRNCHTLSSIPQLNTSNVTNMSSMFGGCESLINVPQLNTSNVTNMSSMFSSCVSLSDTSLDNILQMCINATSYTGTKTLKTIGFQYTSMTSKYPASRIEALPHYQDFIDAGWTIGY